MVSGVEDAICRATDDLILYSNRDYNRDYNSIFETKQQVLPVNELAKPTLVPHTWDAHTFAVVAVRLST